MKQMKSLYEKILEDKKNPKIKKIVIVQGRGSGFTETMNLILKEARK